MMSKRELFEYFAYMFAGLVVGICTGLAIIYLVDLIFKK